MPSSVYPPMSASYSYIQGHNVKNYEIFSQRLIGVLGRSDRSKMVSMTSHKYVTPFGTDVTGSKIINQTSDSYFDDSLYQQGGVTVFEGLGTQQFAVATITILSGAAWQSDGYVDIRLYDTNVSGSWTEGYISAYGTGPQDLTAMTGSTVDWDTQLIADSDGAGFAGGMRFWGLREVSTSIDSDPRFNPYFYLTGSVLRREDLTSGTEYEKTAVIAAHQNITGSRIIALNLYQKISRSLNDPLSPFHTLPLHVSLSGVSASSDPSTQYLGSTITLSVSKEGKETDPSLNSGLSPWLTGSMMRFNIGVTSSYAPYNIQVSSAPAGYKTLSFSSNIGLPSWSESSGSLKMLPQYNLERNNFGYSESQTFTPFVDKTTLLGFGASTSGKDNLHLDLQEYVPYYRSVVDPVTGETTTEPWTITDRWRGLDGDPHISHRPVLARMAGFASAPPNPGAAVTGFSRRTRVMTGSANPFHLGLFYTVNQFISGAEINYGTKDKPKYKYTEGLRWIDGDYDIENLDGISYGQATQFDMNGVIEPLDIRKEITGDHLCIGDFYDPIHNTLKGTLSSTDRVLNHLGITQPIGETYNIVKDTKITPFEYIDNGADIYGLHLTVPPLAVQTPKTIEWTFNRKFDLREASVSGDISDEDLETISRDYDWVETMTSNPPRFVLQEGKHNTPTGYEYTNLGYMRPLSLEDFNDYEDPYAFGFFPVGTSYSFKADSGLVDPEVIAWHAKQAINSSSLGQYLTASLGSQYRSSNTVYITPVTASSGWNDNIHLRNPADDLFGFDKWAFTEKARSKSIGGSFLDYSPYLNLDDLSANPDPFYETESNSEYLETLTRSTDKELQYVIAAKRELYNSVKIFQASGYDSATPWDCTYFLGTVYFRNERIFDDPKPFSSHEKSTPKGIVYENTIFGYDSVVYGGYKK